MSKYPAWCTTNKENYRVEVISKGYLPNLTAGEKDYIRLADDLNELFEEHKRWRDNFHAEVEWDEITRCSGCGALYNPIFCEERKEDVCGHCMQGTLEWAIKVLANSGKRGGSKR